MKKLPKGVVCQRVPIYGGFIFFCQTRKQAIACAKHFGLEEPPKFAGGLTSTVRGRDGMSRGYIVAVYDRSVATLAHELAHACFFLLSDVGVELTTGGANEAFTYLLGWMMSRFSKYMKF